MRKALAIALVLVGFVALSVADEVKDDAAKKELKKLEGTWTLIGGEQEGKLLAADVLKSAKLTIKGDRHTVKVGDDTMIGTHKLDPAKKPTAIDTMDTEGPFKDKTLLGIYEVDGDMIKVCFAPPGKDRPTEFTTKSGTGQIYHVWKRNKE